MFIASEVDTVTKLGLISSSTSGSEEHLEPVLLQVVIEVSPSGLDLLEPGLVGVQMFAGVEPGQVLHLELPGVELLIVGKWSKVGSVGELIGVEVDPRGPDLGVAHHNSQSLANHLIFIERFINNPGARENLIRIDNLEEAGDEVCCSDGHQSFILVLGLSTVGNITLNKLFM